MTTNSDISSLLTLSDPFSSAIRISEAAEEFLRDDRAHLLSIPIVEDKIVIGSISRYQLINIFLMPFGREIYGTRPITKIMNKAPLLVSIEQSLEAAAQHVASKITTPITEDFIITKDGRYLGIGIVLNLLNAVEQKATLSSKRLEEAYQQLKHSQAQLVQSEKMASLGQMVAGVAHEINTPLGYVRNNIEMMQNALLQMRSVLNHHELLLEQISAESPDEEEISKSLINASSASSELHEALPDDEMDALFKDTLFGADQIKELVINLRNFSRLDQAKVADINLNDCLEQTLVIANNVLKGKTEVVKRLGEIPSVGCSPSQINQVFLNLITNASQAIEHSAGRIVLKTEHDAEWVHVSVQDNGKGISQENLKQIFDPFFTTKPIGQGTGLGLSISFQIVQAHGGTIRVSSILGKGSRFVVSLPKRQEIQQQAAT